MKFPDNNSKMIKIFEIIFGFIMDVIHHPSLLFFKKWRLNGGVTKARSSSGDETFFQEDKVSPGIDRSMLHDTPGSAGSGQGQ
jgi:hypothetical protein